MRTVYQTVVIPQMLYDMTAWLPDSATKRNQIINSFINLEPGVFSSMSTAALNVEFFSLTNPTLDGADPPRNCNSDSNRRNVGATFLPPSKTQQKWVKETRLGGFSPLEKLRWKKGETLFGRSVRVRKPMGIKEDLRSPFMGKAH